MSIYSTTEVYPSNADELFDCKSMFCNECTFDCCKENADLESMMDLQSEINTIFTKRGFRSVNWNYFHGEACLTMYKSQTGRFIQHMNEYGYEVLLETGHNKFWSIVFISDEFGLIDPKHLLDIFRAMEVKE